MRITRNRKHIVIICIISIFLVAFVLVRNLTKVMPVEMIYAQAEKQAGQIIVHCSVITAFDRYKGAEVTFNNGKAYIKAYYYAMPLFRGDASGDFTVVLNLEENNVEEVLLTDDDNKIVEIPIS